MELTEKIISIIKNNTEQAYDVKAETNLRDELGIDSFDTLMIVDAIEDEFNITIDESDFTQVKTVQDIVHLLNENYLITAKV